MKRALKKAKARKERKVELLVRMTDIFLDVFNSTKANAAGWIDMKLAVEAVRKYAKLLVEKRPEESALVMEVCQEWEAAMVKVVKDSGPDVKKIERG